MLNLLIVLSLYSLVIFVNPSEAAVSDTVNEQKAAAELSTRGSNEVIKQLRTQAEESLQKSRQVLSAPMWKDALLQSQHGLDSVEADLNGIMSWLKEISNPMKDGLPGVNASYRRLSALSEANKNDPMMLEVIMQRNILVSSMLRQQMSPLLTIQNMLAQMSNSISYIKQGLPPGTDDKVTMTVDRINVANEKLLILNNLVKQELAPAEADLNMLDDLHSKIYGSLYPLWVEYYFSAPTRLFDPFAWNTIELNWKKMLSDMPLRVSIEFPPTTAIWKSASLQFINSLIAGLLLVLIINHFLAIAERREKIAKSVRLSIKYNLLWLLLGIAVILSSFGPEGEQYRGLLILGSIIIIGGETALAWNTRLVQLDSVMKRSPLRSVFVITAIGVIISYPNLPIVVLTLIWFLVCIVSLFLLRKLPDDLPPLESNLIRIHGFAVLCSMAIAFLGWARLAVLLQIVVDCLIISVQLVLGLLVLLNRSSRDEDHDERQGIIAALLVAVVAPSVMLLVIGGVALWIVAMPGGSMLLWHYLGAGVKIGRVSFNLISVFAILGMFYVTRAVAVAACAFIGQAINRSDRIDKTLAPPIQAGVKYGLWAFFVLFSLNVLGFGMENIAVVAGGLSVGIGFGMQTIINNFLSGLILIFSRVLHEGDIVDVGDLQGIVRKISVRATTVETFDNALIFVPNSEFVSNRLVNWTRNGNLVRRTVNVGVAYGTDPNLVEELLIKATESVSAISHYPQPFVLFMDFAESTLNFSLRYWADFAHTLRAASLVRHNIVKIFSENNIEIAFPQLDVHIIPLSDNPPPLTH